MKYSNKQESIYVYLDTNVVYIGNTLYTIDKIYSKIEGKSKFSFDRYIVKIFNDKLSLYDSTTKSLVKTYIKDNDNIDTQTIDDVKESKDGCENQKEWEKYIVKKNLYVYINMTRTEIIINETRHDILSTYELGKCKVYVTDGGIIKLSDKTNTWNDISIMKV